MESRDTLKLRVAYGDKDLGKVKNQKASWSKMQKYLADPKVDETYSYTEYMKLPKEQQDKRKADPGFFVGGHRDQGIRKLDRIKARDVVVLDIDNAKPEQIEYLESGDSELCRFEFFAHTTRKHCQTYPRYRIVIPCADGIDP